MNGTLSIAFIIQNVEITLRLEEFARILRIPYQGICVFTPNWPISSLPNGVDSNLDIYPPPHKDPLLIRDSLFYQRPPSKTRKVKGVATTLDPFQMVLSELKVDLKKWETILSENDISLTRNKDHPNACLCYMLYCLTIGKPFNRAYYIAKRMESVTKSFDMTLPYGMLLTRLFEHVRIAHPYAISDDLYLVDYVMIPRSEKRVFRIMPNGKRHRPQTSTPTESFESPSPTFHQEEENDPVNNYTLDPIPYIDQLPPIEGGESPEFKQTKEMFKCFGHFLSNLGKKNQTISTQGTNVSPLAPRALVFSTPPSSPLEPHPYLTSLNDLPPRISNPPPPSLSQGLSQTLPLPTPMDFKPSFPPINLFRSRLSAQPEPFMSREQVLEELSQLHTFSHNIEEAI
ncbi:hypothetical protein Tco_1353973 [Tanacetum coccineum]